MIGGACTHRAIHGNSAIPDYAGSLSRACSLVGSPQIRNMGTIGGNVVNASPAADTITPLLIHDATVVLNSIGGTRRVGLEAFIVRPYGTSIKVEELLAGIEILPCVGYREGYQACGEEGRMGHVEGLPCMGH